MYAAGLNEKTECDGTDLCWFKSFVKKREEDRRLPLNKRGNSLSTDRNILKVENKNVHSQSPVSLYAHPYKTLLTIL